MLDVWFVDLLDRHWCAPAAAATLSEDERARADRFRFENGRRRFRATRAALRSLLASYLGCDAASLRFELGECGKPRLAAGTAVTPVEFNVAHSGDVGLIAVTSGTPVGVDIERIRALADLERMTTWFFTPSEKAAVWRVPAAERPEAFCRCWVRKEACIKAWGEGLTIGLDTFDVHPALPTPLTVVRTAGGGSAAVTVLDLLPPPGYSAAVVVEGPACRVASGWCGRRPARTLDDLNLDALGQASRVGQ